MVAQPRSVIRNPHLAIHTSCQSGGGRTTQVYPIKDALDFRRGNRQNAQIFIRPANVKNIFGKTYRVYREIGGIKPDFEAEKAGKLPLFTLKIASLYKDKRPM